MKILTVIGTRPEAIKMAPVIIALAKENELISRVCVTGQHREMLDQVLDIFQIQPEYDFNLMQPGQNLCEITARILTDLRAVLSEYSPDIVLVHGDTATCFAASLASFYSGIPVAHIEAGLRTGNIYAPWPEEANRVLVGRIATWHFAPTDRNRKNLIDEGVASEKIIVTGNTVIDSLHWVSNRIENLKHVQNRIENSLLRSGLMLNAEEHKFILVTGHRRENFGAGFEGICSAIKALSLANPKIHFIYPVHLNPNVRVPVNRLLAGLSNVHLISPLDYEPFVYLMKKCLLVLTDSGGVQEEAPGLGKPVLVMRNTTERPEAVEAGTVKLVGTDAAAITSSVQELLDNKKKYNEMVGSTNPYGDGLASSRIVSFLKSMGSHTKCNADQ